MSTGRPDPRGAGRPRALPPAVLRVAAVVLALCCTAAFPRAAGGAVTSGSSQRGAAAARPGTAEPGSLEAAAAKAGDTGRTVAMSLIGLALAVAATVLAFRRDFKEAAGVFAVGIVAVLLATPAGISLLRGTVSSLFGGP